MTNILEKVIYLVFAIFVFIVLWWIVGAFWKAFVPWNYKTDLIGIIVVTPMMIAAALITATLVFKFIRDTK